MFELLRILIMPNNCGKWHQDTPLENTKIYQIPLVDDLSQKVGDCLVSRKKCLYK